MTIQREYTLPHCTLVLEGMGESLTLDSGTGRPLMSVLLNAECLLANEEAVLSGGRDFLENLIGAVSRYAQEFLSGISHPVPTAPKGDSVVQLERVGHQHHRLQVRPTNAPASDPATMSVNLSTVQFFDLLETVDQLLADPQTLPDLTFKLTPLPRQFMQQEEPLTQRVAPVALGVTGLAAATIAIALAPIPRVSEPEDLFAIPPEPSPTASPSPGASPSPTDSPTPSPTASPNAAEPNLDELKATLEQSPAISDPAVLAQLSQDVRTKINDAWKDRTIPQELIYRLGVTEDGSIVGYDFVNEAAAAYTQQTPLLDLLYRPVGERSREPIAQLRVTFKPDGSVDVAPLTPTASPAPLAEAPPEITSNAELEALLPQLRTKLLDNWPEDAPPLEEPLEFRVRVNADGEIVDYRPESAAARAAIAATPLAKLGQLAPETDAPPTQSLAWFKVVLRPGQRLEISPWRGWQE